MDTERSQNVFGALALLVADDVQRASAGSAPEAGPAAAALVLIAHDPGLSIRTLAGAVALSHAGAVRLVDRLAADGLVERQPDAQDRRAVALRLTTQGHDACNAILSARDGVLARGLAVLSAEERIVLAGFSERMLRASVQSEQDAYRICRLCNFRRCANCPVDDELSQAS